MLQNKIVGDVVKGRLVFCFFGGGDGNREMWNDSDYVNSIKPG